MSTRWPFIDEWSRWDHLSLLLYSLGLFAFGICAAVIIFVHFIVPEFEKCCRCVDPQAENGEFMRSRE